MVRSRAALHLEIVALRRQLVVAGRSRRHAFASRRSIACTLGVAVAAMERLALDAAYRAAGDGLAWHRRGFRLFWTWKSRHRTGRPAVPRDVRRLIREISAANPLWGAPRIHGELQKLGISISQASIAKYMRQHPRPASQTWRTFLTNHTSQIMAADLFVVPTVTFRMLFVLVTHSFLSKGCHRRHQPALIGTPATDY